jgi:predicted nucleic acid-binding protein
VIVVDTDAFIDLLRGEGAHRKVATLMRSERLATTAITVFEIWKGLETDSDRELARRSFRGVRVYPLSDTAARRAAELARLLRQNPIGDRDTLIAGVCLAIQRPLLTSNLRHFRRGHRIRPGPIGLS